MQAFQYYDPHLVSLSNEITSLVLGAKNQVISLPRELTTFIRPQRLARAIVGHCLAAVAVNETKAGLVSTPISDALREYFLNPELPMPEELTIYYWPYPSKRQVVVKHMGKSSMHRPGVVYGHVIKFLPLGFWLVWKKPEYISIRPQELVNNRSMGIDETLQVSLDIYNVPKLNFPEAPASHEYIVMNNEYAVIANQKI